MLDRVKNTIIGEPVICAGLAVIGMVLGVIIAPKIRKMLNLKKF